jgi:hypothetical protein
MKEIVLSLKTVFLLLFIFVSLNTYTQEDGYCNAFGENQWALVSSHNGVEFYIAYRVYKNPAFKTSSKEKEYNIHILSKTKNTNDFPVTKIGITQDYKCIYYENTGRYTTTVADGQNPSKELTTVIVERKTTNIRIPNSLGPKETKLGSYLQPSDYEILLLDASVSFNFKKAAK